MKTQKHRNAAKRELDRRLAMLVLSGGSAEGGVLSLLVHAFETHVDRWNGWIQHGVDPFMGRRPASLLMEVEVSAVLDEWATYRIESGKLRIYRSSQTEIGHDPQDCEPPAYAAAIYNRLKNQPGRIVKILRITERATPDRAKPR